jgi:hypothetical protein
VLGVAMLVIVLLTLLAMAAGRLIEFPERHDWESTEGSVIETRIVVDHVSGTLYGGHVVYRLDARVSYSYKEEKLDRWLPVAEDAMRGVLKLREANHYRYCEVYWPPSQPELAKCRLH